MMGRGVGVGLISSQVVCRTVVYDEPIEIKPTKSGIDFSKLMFNKSMVDDDSDENEDDEEESDDDEDEDEED